MLAKQSLLGIVFSSESLHSIFLRCLYVGMSNRGYAKSPHLNCGRNLQTSFVVVGLLQTDVGHRHCEWNLKNYLIVEYTLTENYFDHYYFLITFVLMVSKIMVETNLLVLSHCLQIFFSYWVITGGRGDNFQSGF